jgi:NAD(P) transhydrogenase
MQSHRPDWRVSSTAEYSIHDSIISTIRSYFHSTMIAYCRDRKKQIKSLWRRSFPILKTEAEVLQAKETRDRLSSNGIDLFIGSVEFVDAEGNGSDVTLRVCRPTECVEVVARHAAIASGSRPNRPSELPSGVHLPFLKGRVVTASEMALVALPTSIAIIGGGVIAVEYATVFAQLGVGVSLICSDDEFLPFLEGEIRSSLRERMSREHILFVRDTVREIRVDNSSIGVVLNPSISKRTPMKDRVLPERRLKVDLVLYSGGRNANSEGLELEAVNVSTSKYGRIVVDKAFRTTSSKSIYAIGDVIGPPGLASAAQQHGRSVSETLFGGSEDDDDDEDDDGDYAEFSDEQDNFFSSSSTGTEGGQDGLQQDAADTLFGASSGTITMDAPLTLWTLPEIASVGATLKQAQKIEPRDKLVEGRAYFKDMARGRLSGDSQGYVKIIAKIGAKRHTIIGVHIIGEGANELIQLGSILVHSAASLESVSRTPFAAVTLSGIYQMACDDALLKSPMRKKNKLSSL